MNKFIERPPVWPIAPNEGIKFMGIDIDYYTGKPPNSLSVSDKDQTICWIFGVTTEGNSILAHIYGFLPYFYVLVPPSMNFTKQDQEQLKRHLNAKLQTINGVDSIEVVKKKPIMPYQEEPSRFLKIYCKFP